MVPSQLTEVSGDLQGVLSGYLVAVRGAALRDRRAGPGQPLYEIFKFKGHLRALVDAYSGLTEADGAQRFIPGWPVPSPCSSTRDS